MHIEVGRAKRYTVKAVANIQNKIKILFLFTACLLFRLVPFRLPNLEPILASQMPLSRQFGGVFGFFFGAFSIIFYDLITGTFGLWTLITAPTYGILGFCASIYLKNRVDRKHFVYFAIFGTLFFDAITGLAVGPLFFEQSILVAFAGQIPFTLVHLAGNVCFAFFFSPAIMRWFEREEIINLRLWIPQKI